MLQKEMINPLGQNLIELMIFMTKIDINNRPMTNLEKEIQQEYLDASKELFIYHNNQKATLHIFRLNDLLSCLYMDKKTSASTK